MNNRSKHIDIKDKPNFVILSPPPENGLDPTLIAFKTIYSIDRSPPVKSKRILNILHPVVDFLL